MRQIDFSLQYKKKEINSFRKCIQISSWYKLMYLKQLTVVISFVCCGLWQKQTKMRQLHFCRFKEEFSWLKCLASSAGQYSIRALRRCTDNNSAMWTWEVTGSSSAPEHWFVQWKIQWKLSITQQFKLQRQILLYSIHKYFVHHST